MNNPKSSTVTSSNNRTSSETVALLKSGTPAYLLEVKQTGAGVSSRAEDNLIPMARILQKTSQEVEKRGPSYVEGAEPGDIFLKNAPNPLIKGEKGFLFQPCFFRQAVVEWVPIGKGGGGGAGFVASHPEMPKNAKSSQDPNDKSILINPENGNVYVDTRYHVGFIISEDASPMPAVIPFASTGHTVSRGWMFLMNQKSASGSVADSFAVYYHLSTRMKSKGQQSWHMFEIKDAGPVVDGVPSTLWVPTKEDYDRGLNLYKSLTSGQTKFEEAAPREEATVSDTF